MCKLFVDFRAAAALCLFLAATGASPGRADALPSEEIRDPTGSKSAPPLPTSSSASPDVEMRQHVKHLRAHKKSVVDETTDTSRLSDKAESAQTSRANPEQTDSGQKADAGGAVASTTARPVAKPRGKISRSRTRSVVTVQRVSGENSRIIRERDFFSDIFGGDE
jgi:hypothetical protein